MGEDTGAGDGTLEPAEIEARIVAAVQEGKVARFARGADGTPVHAVSAQFLADLWLDRSEEPLHPRGIAIEGLLVTGSLDLKGARQTGRGATHLLSLRAAHCRFDSAVNLEDISCETLEFLDCYFASSVVNSAKVSLVMNDAEIAGSFTARRCRFEARISAIGCRTTGAFSLRSCDCRETTQFTALHVDNNLNIVECKMGLNAAEQNPQVMLRNARIGGRVNVRDNEFGSNFNASAVKCFEARLLRNRFDGKGPCALDLAHLRASGGVDVRECTVRALAQFDNAEIDGDIGLKACRFPGGWHMANSIIRGNIELRDSLVMCEPVDGFAIALHETRAASVTLQQARVRGSTQLRSLDARSKVQLIDCVFGSLSDARSEYTPDDEDAVPKLRSQSLCAGVNFELIRCTVRADCDFSNLSLGISLLVRDCRFERTGTGRAVRLSGSRVGGSVELTRSRFASGIRMTGLQCDEILVEGCLILPATRDRRTSVALWASDSEIGRRVRFGYAVRGKSRIRNRIVGKVDFSSCKIGERFIFRSSDLRPSRLDLEQRSYVMLDLARSIIEGDVQLAPMRPGATAESELDRSPARVLGCISLDNARIAGRLQLDYINITALPTDQPFPIGERPRRKLNEEKQGVRKERVALSLRDAKIDGEVNIIRAPDDLPENQRWSIDGIVDMSDAQVGRIADGGGDNWESAGLTHGDLRLDGLVYERLDSNEALPSATDLAEQRIKWLELQYFNSKPKARRFLPQPYEQLAAYFASQGNEYARRRVQIERRNLQRRFSDMGWFNQRVQGLLYMVSGYGYRPRFALLVAAIYLLAGALAVWLLDLNGVFMLADRDTVAVPLNPLLYALDSAVPIIDLEHESLWTIDESKVGHIGHDVMQVLDAIYEIAGMLLVSIIVLTLTGTLRDGD